MSNDEVRPSGGAVRPPSDITADEQAEGAGSEPLYWSVLLCSGLRRLPGWREPARMVSPTPPLPVPVPVRAKAVASRYLANGRQLRLLPGGRPGDPPRRFGETGRPGEAAPGLTRSPVQDSKRPYRLQVLLPAREAREAREARQARRLREVREVKDDDERHRARGPHPAAGCEHSACRAGGPGGSGSLPSEPSPSRERTGDRAADGPPSRRDRRDQRDQPAAGHRSGQPGQHRRHGSGQRPAPKTITLGELRALWAAQNLSSAGDLVAQVAIAIAVFDQTRSPFLTALAYALTYLPPVLGGRLLSGLTADLPPRSVMVALDLARAALVASMALAGLPVAGLCVLLFAVMLLATPFSAARATLLRSSSPAVRRPGAGLSSGAISFQTSQALGFLLGAAAVAVLRPGRVLLIDAATFGVSAALLAALVRHRPAGAGRRVAREEVGSPRLAGQQITSQQATDHGADAGAGPASVDEIDGPGVAATFRSSPMLRTLLLLGWLAGFYVVPEGLAVPYAHALGGGPLSVGLLMAAMPVGAVAGIITFTRATRPEAGTQLLGWLAMLCCMPLAFCSLRPPLWVVLILWALAGAGTAYQLVVAAAFCHMVRDDGRRRDWPARLGPVRAAGRAGTRLRSGRCHGPADRPAGSGRTCRATGPSRGSDYGQDLGSSAGPAALGQARSHPGARAARSLVESGPARVAAGQRPIIRCAPAGPARVAAGQRGLSVLILLDHLLSNGRWLVLLRDHHPRRQINQHAEACGEDREEGEDQPDHVGVHAEILADA